MTTDFEADQSASFATVDAGDSDTTQIANNSTFGSMLWIGFYTTLLNIITLTLFRFWGRTQFRRRLWSETTVGGEPLEYTGSGIELFVGFLIAIVTLMVPMLGSLIAAQLLFGEVGFLIAYFFVYIAFLVVIGIALFLARRYHLSRTRLRGVRFAQTGSAITYGTKFFLYLLLSIVTLGWFSPAMRLRLSEYMWNNAFYGNEPFAFNRANSMDEPVYKSFALAWVGGVIAYAVFIAMFSSHTETLTTASGDPEAMTGVIFALYGALFVVAIISLIFSAWHEAVMIRKVVKSLTVAGARFNSSFTTMDIIWLTFTNLLIVIFTLGIGSMVAQMRVWRKIANKMEMVGSVNYSAIQQSAEEGPSQGEGLADGLDLVSNF